MAQCLDDDFLLPDEVIDDNAFFAASNLSQINFNEGLKKIGKSAFYNTSLARVEIPATVDTIGNT
ncbi:MAG: leucine-rich repeat protein, partial [Selenomonadaceae bacterium]|nr:leucine-rich repeat protein [Selenomonadaceae bacterium]